VDAVNSDQVKEKLLKLRKPREDFTVVLSGKASRKVHGLYKPETREIVLHNKNFKNDNELMYTAIHEFAHHLQFLSSQAPLSARAHTVAYWNLLHTLLFEAEEKGLYRNPFESIPEFRALTREIRERFLAENGERMKELGALLAKGMELCEKHGTSFPDWLDRVLAIPRASAHAILKAHTLDLDSRLGWDNMRTVAAIRDDGDRKKAEEAFLSGSSPDMVKTAFGAARKSGDGREELVAERDRVAGTIRRLQARLEKIEERLEKLEEDS
jgi:hypothetical protein